MVPSAGLTYLDARFRLASTCCNAGYQTIYAKTATCINIPATVFEQHLLTLTIRGQGSTRPESPYPPCKCLTAPALLAVQEMGNLLGIKFCLLSFFSSSH